MPSLHLKRTLSLFIQTFCTVSDEFLKATIFACARLEANAYSDQGAYVLDTLLLSLPIQQCDTPLSFFLLVTVVSSHKFHIPAVKVSQLRPNLSEQDKPLGKNN